MSVFDEFQSREELLRAVEGAITAVAHDDGGERWRIEDKERDALQRRCELADRSVAQERRRAERLEAKLEILNRERAQENAELAKLREINAANLKEPDDFNNALRRYAQQAEVAKSKLAALEAELAPIKEANARYKERETRGAIEAQLVDAARKLNCCESALRDVKRLANLFRLNEAGVAVDNESRSVEEALREEIALSPHWLNRSRGADAAPGDDVRRFTRREEFLDALERDDFVDAIRFAPRR